MDEGNRSQAFLFSPNGKVIAESRQKSDGTTGPGSESDLEALWRKIASVNDASLLQCLDGLQSLVPLYDRDEGMVGAVGFQKPSVPEHSFSEATARPYRPEVAEQVVIFALSTLAEWRDPSSGEHFRRIRNMTRLIAEEIRNEDAYSDLMTDEYLIALFNAALIHDIGKLAIPDMVLKKRGRLTKDEYELMKKHPVIGQHILREVSSVLRPSLFLMVAMEVVLCHHESWDGSGYPQGLTGYEIPLSARIVGLADLYDAIHQRRCYKDRIGHQEAVEIVKQEAGKKLDPVLVEAFLRVEKSVEELQHAWDHTNNAYDEMLSPFHEKVESILYGEAAVKPD